MVRDHYNVLIVDTDFALAEETKIYLNNVGFNVLGITTKHEETISLLQKKNIDILLMDIDINGRIDGIESCDIIYKKYHIPSIFITSFYDEEALFMIQNSNAYGYILKPFKKEMLKVTMLLTLKKLKKDDAQSKNDKILLKNDFKFSIKNKILYRNNYEINLTKNERTLIYTLVKHKNNNISYEILFNQIWRNKRYCINKIRGAIFRLKKKLPDLLITNNYELGYKIE